MPKAQRRHQLSVLCFGMGASKPDRGEPCTLPRCRGSWVLLLLQVQGRYRSGGAMGRRVGTMGALDGNPWHRRTGGKALALRPFLLACLATPGGVRVCGAGQAGTLFSPLPARQTHLHYTVGSGPKRPNPAMTGRVPISPHLSRRRFDFQIHLPLAAASPPSPAPRPSYSRRPRAGFAARRLAASHTATRQTKPWKPIWARDRQRR